MVGEMNWNVLEERNVDRGLILFRILVKLCWYEGYMKCLRRRSSDWLFRLGRGTFKLQKRGIHLDQPCICELHMKGLSLYSRTQKAGFQRAFFYCYSIRNTRVQLFNGLITVMLNLTPFSKFTTDNSSTKPAVSFADTHSQYHSMICESIVWTDSLCYYGNQHVVSIVSQEIDTIIASQSRS